MDPYLEQFWLDVHAGLMIYIRDQLEEQLPANLIARVEERIVFELEEDVLQARYPDIKITEQPGRGNGRVAVVGKAAVAEPVIVECDPVAETFIQILEAGPEQRLVSVLEILSLANKLPGECQDEYRRKLSELRDTGVSLVEIDLLRRGERMLGVPKWLIPPRARTTYQVCVRRGWKPYTFEIYPVPLRRPLPSIRIPLRKTDDDIRLDLQAVLEQAYRKGRYHLTIDYTKRPDPPLAALDAKWAKRLLKTPGKKKR
jgi:hypothetical protein